jgi:hypothetical protein
MKIYSTTIPVTNSIYLIFYPELGLTVISVFRNLPVAILTFECQLNLAHIFACSSRYCVTNKATSHRQWVQRSK